MNAIHARSQLRYWPTLGRGCGERTLIVTRPANLVKPYDPDGKWTDPCYPRGVCREVESRGYGYRRASSVLRMDRAARRRRGDGRHAAGPDTGPRSDHGAAARGPADQSGPLR